MIKLQKRFQNFIRKRYTKKVVSRLLNNHKSHLYNFHLDRILTFARYAYDNSKLLSSELYISHGVRALSAAYTLSTITNKNYIYDAIEVPSFKHRNTSVKWHPTVLDTIELLNDFYIKNTSEIMTVSESLGNYLRSYKLPVHVIPNYRLNNQVELSLACHNDCLHRLVRVNSCKKLVLILSTITSHVESLILSINHLPKDVDLVFLGEIRPEAYKQSMQKFAKDNKVYNRCHWIKPIPYHNLIKTIACAKLGIILLDPERLNSYLSLPNRIFDYFAATLPIISPDIPDIRNLLFKHKCGLILKDINPLSWSQAINKVLLDLNFYKLNMTNLNQLYSWTSCESNLLKIINGRESVTILSMNDLVNNQRARRIAGTLANNGVFVKIFCLSNHEQKYFHPNIQYHILKKF
ncbi:Uncharacterised protein [Legionella beliardensis]|uniref:Uncharacterized protein n=1 Tax=Legionella beliardensis TaxID=91822 RepID=A0A378I2E9_9GAMM|nr:hypothetical protein [Legionella beliardensis]STX28910.1 Uncharacterised protein [Legionella beliardensis]